MNKILNIALKIQQYSSDQQGVFTLGDLKNIIAPRSKDELYEVISALIKSNICNKFSRGFYNAPDFDPRVLSQRICQDSYVSFGSVLAEKLIIGSIPKYKVAVVKLGRSHSYSNGVYTIQHYGIKRDLFFGYENVNGVNIATPEKALLDTLYFYKKGISFSFEIYSDLDLTSLDKEILYRYLELYKDKRFVTFAKRLINEEY